MGAQSKRVCCLTIALALAACGRESGPQPATVPDPKPAPAPAVPAVSVIVGESASPEKVDPSPVAPVVEAPPSDEALAVVAAQPQGVVEAMVRPAITFDRPVRALGALDDTRVRGAEIRPGLNGRWKWLGSRTLEFAPDGPAPLSTAYAVRVPAGLVALDGAVLAEDYVYTFETPRLRPIYGDPITSWREYGWVRLDQVFEVTFNQPFDSATVDRGLYLEARSGETVGRKTALKILRVETPHEQAVRLAAARGDDPPTAPSPTVTPDRRQIATLTPQTALASDTSYALVFGSALRSADGPLAPAEIESWAFRTYGPLQVEAVECHRWHGGCADGPLTIEFTNRVATRSLRQHVQIQPKVELRWPDDAGEDDAGQSQWTIYGEFLPATAYTITIDAAVTDEFGQRLGESVTAPFRTGDYGASLHGRDNRALIEKGHRAALPLTHVNVPEIDVQWMRLTPETAIDFMRNPWRKEPPPGVVNKRLKLDAKRNQWQRSPLELERLFLDDAEAVGRLGWVQFGHQLGQYKQRDQVFVQQSDLGVFLKVSPVTTRAWIWRLSSGASVADAKVEIVDENGRVLAEATTKADGTAETIGVAAMDVPALDRWGNPRWGPPFLAARVTHGDDVALASTADNWDFSPWRYGLEEAWDAAPPKAEGLVFTDRGIYRPGETLYAKAILRERTLGKLEIREGRAVDLKLLDPEGETIAARSGALSAYGTIDAEFTLPADGRLGEYRVEVVDPQTKLSWETRARVAEYRAPSFLVSVEPAEGERMSGQPVKAAVEGRYLFGGAMSGAELSWSMHASAGRFEPKSPADAGFVFGRRYAWWSDEGGESDSRFVASGAWTLDDDGRFVVEAGAAQTPEDRPQVYTVEASVTDVDRQVVAGRASFPVHPASFYVGLKGPSGFATAGEAFDVEVVAVGASDETRREGDKATLRLMRHVWQTVKKRTVTGRFETISEKKEIEVGICEVTTPAKCTFTATESGYHELVAQAADAGGRKTTSTDGLWVAGPGYAAWLQDDDHKVEVIADRGVYDVGETARLLVQSPFPEAEAWVTVEREGVLSQRRVKLRGTATPIEVEITPELIPNAFVSVVLARGRSQPPGKAGDPGRPAFRLGYAQLRVLPAHKRLAVTLAPDASEKRPGTDLSIDVTVADRHGKGAVAEVAIWAVDEGVLALTGYETPDPIAALYRPRGLSVRQSTNLAHLVPQLNYGEKGREQGGGGGSADAMELRNQFVTTPVFVGATETDASGKARVTGKLPDNLTTFRLMAVAITKDHRAGKGESKVVVNQPVMAKPALPRAVRIGDRFAAGVVVHTRLEVPTEITVKAEVIDGPLVRLDAEARHMTAIPGRALEVRFAFEASADAMPGTATLRFSVVGGDHHDTVEKTLPVTLPVATEAVAVYGDVPIAADGSKKSTEGLLPPGGVRPGIGGLDITLASSALVGLDEATRQLIDYPYGCLEQQTSRLVPFVALKSLLERYGQAWVGDREPEAVVAETTRKILALQRPDGGFAYWASSRCPHYWGTAYAAMALGEAKRAGYAVDAGALDRALRYVEAHWDKPAACTVWGGRTDDERAFGAYVLARAERPVRSFHKRLFPRRKTMSLFGRALLAHAMSLSGADAAGAATIVRELGNFARPTPSTVHFEEADPATYAPVFHSDTRTTALVLQAMLAVDAEHDFVPKMARSLVEARHGGRYRTTQEAAFSLMALADYARIVEAQAPDMVATVALPGRTLAAERFSGAGLHRWTHHVPIVDLGPATAKPTPMIFGGQGVGRLYYSALLRYAPVEMPTTARDEGITVQRWYAPYGRDGRVRSVAEGDLVEVHVRVATSQRRHYVVVDDPLPSGLEAVDTSLATTGRQTMATDDPELDDESDSADATGRGVWYQVFNHVEMRDDRVVLFADRMPPGLHTYRYVARATTAGTFVLKPARAEEMYAPEIFGRSDGGTFWVHPRAELSQR